MLSLLSQSKLLELMSSYGEASQSAFHLLRLQVGPCSQVQPYLKPPALLCVSD
jgi:hypothetical protein